MISKGNNIFGIISKGANAIFAFISKGINFLFRRFNIRVTPAQNELFTRAPNDGSPVVITYTYPNSLLLQESDITIPEWSTIRSLNLTGSGSDRISTLTLILSNNTQNALRSGQISANFNNMATIVHTVRQNRPAQILGATFVREGEDLPSFPTSNPGNIDVESGGQFDLWVFSDGLSRIDFNLSNAGNLRLGDGTTQTDMGTIPAGRTSPYSIPAGSTRLKIDLTTRDTGTEGGPFTLSIDPDDAFSAQGNVAAQNGVNRTVAFASNVNANENNPIPGDRITITIEAVNSPTGSNNTFEIFHTDRTTANRIDTVTLSSGNNATFTVAFPAGVNGVARDTDILTRVTNDTLSSPANVHDNTIRITSRAINTTQTPESGETFIRWNESQTAVLTSTIASDRGTAPTGWRTNQFTIAPVNTFGGTVTVTTGTSTASNGVTYQTFFSEPNHSTLNNRTVNLNITFAYANTAYNGDTSVDLGRTGSILTTNTRPLIPMRVFAGGSQSVFMDPDGGFDFDAAVSVVLITDTGDAVNTADGSTAALVNQSRYPTVDLTTTMDWIDDDDQMPTNAELTADTTNQLRDAFTTAELDTLQTEQMQAAPAGIGRDIFDDGHGSANLISGFENLRPYAAKYTIVHRTLDDGEVGADGVSVGRNTSGSNRDDDICYVENTRTV